MLEAETMDGNNILLYSITGYIVQYMSGTPELVNIMIPFGILSQVGSYVQYYRLDPVNA